MSGNLDWTEVVGLTLICSVICVLLGCTLLMRVLAHSGLGRPTVTLRTWFFISATFEQLSFMVFHIKYYTVDDYGDTLTQCVVLRFLMTLTSTFTMMWLLVVAAYYYTLTVLPAKCSTFSCRFLSQCVAWTWTGVSGLVYLILTFLMRAEQHQPYIKYCWNDISNTVHLYFGCGTDFVVYVSVIACLAAARWRLVFRPTQSARRITRAEYRDEVDGLAYNVNLLTAAVVLLMLYYAAILARYHLVAAGSDLLVMSLQAVKGLIYALFICILDRNVRAVLNCRSVELKENPHANDGHLTSDVLAESTKCNGFELETFVDEH